MSNVLTTTSAVKCAHPLGHLDFSGVKTKLTVENNPVILENDVTGASVVDCPVQDSENPTVRQCQKVGTVTAGWSTKLKVGKHRVMLDSLVGTTNGVPAPVSLQVSNVQIKLTSV